MRRLKFTHWGDSRRGGALGYRGHVAFKGYLFPCVAIPTHQKNLRTWLALRDDSNESLYLMRDEVIAWLERETLATILKGIR